MGFDCVDDVVVVVRGGFCEMGMAFEPSSWSVSIICFAARVIVCGSVVMGVPLWFVRLSIVGSVSVMI